MKLLASGREADVYALDDDRVLRRLRRGRPTPWEADLARHLRDHAFPAPAVLDVDGHDTVFERVAGPSMLDDIGARPWLLERHARTLAALHVQLHRLPAPSFVPTLGPGTDRLVHLDLHPGNVILGPDGPVVIDWTNAASGRGADDVALTWVIMQTATIPVGGVQRAVLAAGRSLFVRRFLAASDRRAATAALAFASGLRLCDPSLAAEERGAVTRLHARAA